MAQVTTLAPADDARSLADVGVLTAAVEAAGAVREVVWQAGGDELTGLLGLLGEVAVQVAAAEVAVVAEAVVRAEPRTGPVPLATGDWIAAYSRNYPTRASAARLALVAEAIAASQVPDCLRDVVVDGSAPVAAAAAAITEMRRLAPDLQPGFVPEAWQQYATLACTGDLAQVRGLRPWLIATYGPEDLLARDEERARARVSLSRGGSDGGELTDYRLSLDPQLGVSTSLCKRWVLIEGDWDWVKSLVVV